MRVPMVVFERATHLYSTVQISPSSKWAALVIVVVNTEEETLRSREEIKPSPRFRSKTAILIVHPVVRAMAVGPCP
jgi:hypothetical protein